MRIKYILCLCCWLTIGVGAAQRDVAGLYEKYTGHKEVSSVYISKAMLELLPMNELSAGFDFTTLQGKIESLTILSTEAAGLVKKMRKDFRELAENKSYEKLMCIKEDDSVITIYIRKKPGPRPRTDKKDNPVGELLLIVDEEDEFLSIRILGNFTLEELSDLTNRNEQDDD